MREYKLTMKFCVGPIVTFRYDLELKSVLSILMDVELCKTQDKMRYIVPAEEMVKAMVAWGWTVELDQARAVSKAQIKRKVSKLALVSTPRL